MEEYKDIRTFDEMIELEHGEVGTESRIKYEEGAQMFIVSEMLKSARKEAKLTQAQLAEKAGTSKSYIIKNMKSWSLIICNLCLLFLMAHEVRSQNIQIDSDFPGGNIQTDSIRGNTVYLQPDLRDTRTNWFYWYFAVKSSTSDSIRFVFNRPNCMTVKGPAASTDGGKTWSWYFTDRKDVNEFTCFIESGREYRFSMGMPYTEEDFDDFIQPFRDHPSVSMETLCMTREGRAAEKLIIQPKNTANVTQKVLLTARHHACEMMANYVMEGIISTVLSDDPVMEEFRETTEFWIILFMDKDGVEDGDQGKNRNPRDHNRDYIGESIYCTTSTLRREVPGWGAGQLKAAIDLHCPWIKGNYNEVIYMVGTEKKEIAENQEEFVQYILDHNRGQIQYDPQNGLLPFGTAWNTAKNYEDGRSFSSWASTLPGMDLATTFEIPYAVHNEHTMNMESLRSFGKDLAYALCDYLNK